MAIRVSDTEVREVIELAVTTVTTPFILLANQIVDRIETNDIDSDLSTAELKEIERWLSAHFTAIRDKRISSEKAGPVGANYQYEIDLGFDSTMYGQTAKRLDITGTLAKMDSDAKGSGAITPEIESW